MLQSQMGINNCDYKHKLRNIFWDNDWLKFPWFIIHYFVSLARTVFLFLFLKQPTDADIIRLIETTCLALGVKKCETGRVFLVEHCLLELTVRPFKISSIKIHYSDNRVTTMVVNGITETSNRRVIGFLTLFLTASAHTKCHLFSNWLTEYILDNDLEHFYPSTWVSLPLHHTLMRGSVSPIQFEESDDIFGSSYRIPVTRDSVLREASNMSFFKNHQNVPRDIPYLAYLHDARSVVAECVSSAGLPASLVKPFFNHTVVHAADHMNTYATLKDINMNVWFDGSWQGTFVTRMFIEQIIQPVVSPLLNNQLRHLKQPFYKQLYRGLRFLDQEYGFDIANSVTASIMY